MGTAWTRCVFRVVQLCAVVGLCLAQTHSAQAKGLTRVAVLELEGERLNNKILNLITDEVRAGVLDATKGRDFVVMSRENMSVILDDMGIDISCVEGACEVETGRNVGAAFVVSGNVLKVDRSWVCTLKIHKVSTGALVAADKVVKSKPLELSDGVRVLAATLMRESLAESERDTTDNFEEEVRLVAEASRQDEEDARRQKAEGARRAKADAKARAKADARNRADAKARAKADAKARTKADKADAKADRERAFEERRAEALAAGGKGTIVVDNGWWVSVGVGLAKTSGTYESFVSTHWTSRALVGRKMGGLVVGGALSTSYANVAQYESQAEAGCAQLGSCLPGDFYMIRVGGLGSKGVYMANLRLDLLAEGGMARMASAMSEKYYKEEVVNDAWGLSNSPPDIGISNNLPYVGTGVAVRKAVFDGRPTAELQLMANYIVGFGVVTDLTFGVSAAF